MAKELAKKIGVTAVEKALQSFLPELLQKLDAMNGQILDVRKELNEIRKEMNEVRKEMNDLRKEIDAKFERTHELINELGLRVIKVDTKVDTFHELVRSTSDKMDGFRERLVRVEVTQSLRRKRAS